MPSTATQFLLRFGVQAGLVRHASDWWVPIALVEGFVSLFWLMTIGIGCTSIALFDVVLAILVILGSVGISIFSHIMLVSLDLEWWQ